MLGRFLGGVASDLWMLVRVYRGEDVWKGGGARAIVVLGAEVLPGGRASRTLDARTRHAAGLYGRGGFEVVVPTGGLGENGPTEAEVMRRILLSCGVPGEVIVCEDGARNTWDSAVSVAEVLRRRGIREARLVTDPLHCVRTVSAFREAGVEGKAEPVYGSPMWRYESKRRGQLLREMGAVVWYGVRHGVGSRSRP